MDQKRRDEQFFGVSNLPEERLDVGNLSITGNRPLGRGRGRGHHRAQASTSTDRFKFKRSEHDRNSWRNSNQADREFSNNTSDKTDCGSRNLQMRDCNSKTFNVSQRKNIRVPAKSYNDENDSSGAESTMSRSSTFSVPSYPRSSSSGRQRFTLSGTERTNRCDRKPGLNEKAVKFQSIENEQGSSRADRYHKRNRRNEFNESNQCENRSEMGRFKRQNERDEDRNGSRSFNKNGNRNESNRPGNNSRNYNKSQRKNIQVSAKTYDNENDSSGAESTMSRSSTFRVLSSYPRSSSARQRLTHSGTERTNRCDGKPMLNEKAAEFQSIENEQGSSREDRYHKLDRRNEFNERNERNKSEKRSETGRFKRHNEHDEDRKGSQSLNKNGNRNESKMFIGYKYLKALSEKEPHEMILEILRPKADINFVLKREVLQPDWIILIMETVRKLCDSDFRGNRIQILQFFCESSLLDHISRYLGEIALENNSKRNESLNSFISNLVAFYSAVIKTIPTVAVDKNFSKFLTKTEMSVVLIKQFLPVKIDKTVVEELANLKKMLEDETNIRVREKKVEKPRRQYFEPVSDMPPPDDFRKLSLYPTQEDLNRYDFGFIRPNKIKGAYEDVNHYLDVQFRLIREDFVGPLRKGLRSYKDAIAIQAKPKYKYESVRFYPNVQIENIEVTKENQVAYIVNLNSSGRLKNVKWEYSKWFMFGSLLLFTRDNFESFFFAIVYNRDLERLKKGRILVKLVGDEPLQQEMLNQPFLMAESEVYFEPYCLVMKALKEYNENDFPMRQFIVNGNTAVDLPEYIRKSVDFYIYDYSVNLALNNNWPNRSIIGFDEYQYNAFRTALRSNFTVIQGPPGTGKTYLGLKIVEVLLNNININPNVFKTPILLVCYTNHALDQFLEGILNFTQRIVRVGGQSKSNELKPYNLRGRENLINLRREARKLQPTMNKCRDEMKRILFQLRKKSEEKKIIETPEGILSFGILSEVMKPVFKQAIYNERILLEWLLPIEINDDPSVAQNSADHKLTNNSNVDSDESMEFENDEFLDEEDDETMEANMLVNDDEVFDEQEIRTTDMSVKYCVSVEGLEKALLETDSKLSELEKNQHKFEDFSEYHNAECELIEELKNTNIRHRMLEFYLHRAALDSSEEYNPPYVNLHEIPIDQRWRIYWSWVSALKNNFTKQLKNLDADYRSKLQQYEELKQIEDLHVVKNSLVVGMTTTCAARLQLLLKTLSPAVVIVEEAAEVLEAHIVVSLSKKCEHVILIGDHKQLKPSAAVYELSKHYNIDVSLFERMINNHMYCPQLQIQHRMRPEISSLIVPSIYPDLKNHESVLEYPSVKGITKNLFFVEHNVYEEQVDNSSSRKNKFEADFMIQLCRYILLQGYPADQITILTTYTGQMFLLREMKRDHAIMKSVKVIVVDKYQGEENNIILLSLVRSNKEGNIGFLNIENRVCVALSRAKIGLYIIGNMDILSSSNLWKNIKEELIQQKAIGPKLTLYCDKHDVYTQVSLKKDFNNVIEGGCHNFCHEIMDCGHKCQLLCHKIDMEHLEKTCREKCLKKCIENHECKKYCYEDCGQCTVPVERALPCGHMVTLQCFKDYLQHPCQVEVSVVLEHCLHEVKKKCHQSIEEVHCTFPCEDRLECGHQCVKNCHKTNDPDHLEYKCKKPCDKINDGCSKEHKCEKLCFEDCGKCKVRVDFALVCGHSINLMCSANLDRVKCYNRCNRKCSDCNVICPKKCYEDCKPCKNIVKKRVPNCGHEIKLECSVAPEQRLCREQCQRVTICGHKCKSLCGELCGTKRCEEIVKSNRVRALCGHEYANVSCWRRNETIDAEELLPYCSELCDGLLKCGDLCTGTCGSCWQGRLHKTCENKCGNVLVCGHSCSFPCRNVCPPCTKNCQYRCKHSKCPKKCGVPCVHCKEKCEWRCAHKRCSKKCGDVCDRDPCYEPCAKKLKCDHDCIGFCGEPCPDKCRICDQDEVTTILFGNEDEEDARFVLLVDCGHYIESEAMDRYIALPAEKGEIVMKVCPICKTPIAKTLRYMNQVKKVYQDILNVKKKIYGNEKEMKEIRARLTQKLLSLDLNNDQLFRKELHLIPKTVIAFNKKLELRGKQSHISNQALRAMHFFADMFSSIISRLNDLSECTESRQLRIFKKLELILKRVDPEALLINTQQVDDLERELNRYHRMVDFCVCQNNPQYKINRYSPSVMGITVDISNILYGLKCFDNDQDAQIGELFEKLRKELKSAPLSQEEKRMIHTAMAKDFYGGVASQGHWFTCTNGHYYCITECGGAMQESKCPECGEKIGGTEHRYVETARVASDMDGATRPAWSSGADIRNFHFD
ncbi:NFX1-type zinc finger-containing protein 1-like [Planococcus citri]|uniref:NFX1-type zinc finger-containing protein 1-like n=1 Tax=Planococcus citri TaxID=170843 RepID=UPI0031F8BFF8